MDITATTMTQGNSAFVITVPASTSSGGLLGASALWVKDASSNTLASMSNAGSLALRGYISAHTSLIACATKHAGQCVDYAESYPTSDTALEAGDTVAKEHGARAYKPRALRLGKGALYGGSRVCQHLLGDDHGGEVGAGAFECPRDQHRGGERDYDLR